MKKNLLKKVLAILTILVLTFSIVACGKEKTIIGTWVETSDSADEYVFNEDRTGTYTMNSLLPISITYTIEGDKISIVKTVLDKEQVESYNYKLDDDKLTMTIDGKVVSLERQK